MLITISITVIAACIVIVMVFSVPVLLQIYRTSVEIRRLSETARAQIVPITTQVTEVIHDVRSFVQSIDGHGDEIHGAIIAIRNAAVRLQEFQGEMRDKALPLLKMASIVGLGSKGILSFIKLFRR